MNTEEIKNHKQGFTLLELLVVVLIIGVLTAIALPGYRKSVERSKVADALTTMSAVAKSEQGWYMIHNVYTKDFSDLDIELTDRNGERADASFFTTQNYAYDLLEEGLLVSRLNGEYYLYKDYENGQVMCIPSTHYICDNFNNFTKVPCEKAGLAWANTDSTCYFSNKARCQSLHGNSMWHDDTENPENSYCGYYNAGYNKVLNEGMVCFGDYAKCGSAIVNSGGECSAGCIAATVNNGGVCSGNCHSAKIYSGGECSGNCYMAKIYTGGVCTGGCGATEINDGAVCSGDCYYAKIKDGGICKSSATNNCGRGGSNMASYTGTGCCCGNYCGSAPKCDAERCAEI